MKTIIISRTDAIGDVVLTLPLAGILKTNFPACKVIFFGRSYTEPVIELSKHVDSFLNYDDFVKLNEKDQSTLLKSQKATDIIHVYPRSDIARAAKKAGIPNRVGTSHRWYHWFSCNAMFNFSRKKSDLHEAQLNTKLLKGLQINPSFSKAELTSYYGLKATGLLSDKLNSLIKKEVLNVLIHPRSHGSAREWGLDNYKELIILLNKSGVNCIITGSVNEQKELLQWLTELPEQVVDLTGKLNLRVLITLINTADGIVAGSTGPLHLAAALGKNTLGFFPPIRPMHAGRWAPIGIKAGYLTFDKEDCNDCRKNPVSCSCIKNISVVKAAEVILGWKK
jgi:heptosyltransferase III